MAEFEEISNEEKLQIAQHYLLSSPPSQFHEVLSDVRKLLPEGLLTDALATGIARVYNTKNGKVVTTPSGEKTVVALAGEVDATHYIDPNTGAVFGIDHLTLATTEDPIPTSPFPSLELKRAALQAALKSYVSKSFQPDDSAVGVFASNGHIVIVITSEKPNLRNYWSGKWSSVWTVKVEGETSISGEIKIHAHYFEDGNVQLQTAKSVPATALQGAAAASEAGLVDAVIAVIESAESTLRTGLDDVFNNLNTDTLRAMRRTMAITRSKMEWNVNAVRMIRQVRK